jgi:hypothetical protein
MSIIALAALPILIGLPFMFVPIASHFKTQPTIGGANKNKAINVIPHTLKI